MGGGSAVLLDLIIAATGGDKALLPPGSYELLCGTILGETENAPRSERRRSEQKELTVSELNTESPKPKAVTFPGAGGKEKREIYELLKRYRTEHGLGCFESLAGKSGGALNADQIRDMHAGLRYPLSAWHALASALNNAQ